MRDEWYARPDLKPYPAMVPVEEHLSITEKSALKSHYQSYRNKLYKEEKKKKSWYRLFFPLSADFETTHENPY